MSLVRDILERPPAASGSKDAVQQSSSIPPPPDPSSSRTSGFPNVPHRSERKRVSAFKRARAEGSDPRERRPVGSNAQSSLENFQPYRPSGNPLSEPSERGSIGSVASTSKRKETLEDDILRSIQSDNEAQVARMSNADRLQEEQELEEMLGAGLLNKLRLRAQRQMGQSHTSRADVETSGEVNEVVAANPDGAGPSTSVSGRGLDLTPPRLKNKEAEQDAAMPVYAEPIPSPSATNVPSKPQNNTKARSVKFDLDSEQIRQTWFSDEDPNPSSLEWTRALIAASSGSSSHQQTRFDLSGDPLSSEESSSIASHLGLHHHGKDADQAGYTLEEIVLLCGSSFAPQKRLMLGLAGKVLSKTADYAAAIRAEIGRADFVAKCSRLSENVIQSNERNLGLLTEAISTWSISMNHRDAPSPRPRLMSSLLDDILPRLKILLSSPLAESVLPAQSISDLLSGLLALSDSHIETADQIVSVIPTIAESFILRAEWPLPADKTRGQQGLAVIRTALDLINSGLTASRKSAESLLRAGVCGQMLLRYLAAPDTHQITSRVLRIFEGIARYGLNGSVVSVVAPLLPPISSWVCQQLRLPIDQREPHALVTATAYLDLLRTWIVTATNPHFSTIEHDLMWTQIAGLGWEDEAEEILDLLLFSGQVSCDATARLVPSASCINLLTVWVEGAAINAVRKGEDQRQHATKIYDRLQLEQRMQEITASRPEQALHFIQAVLRFRRCLGLRGKPVIKLSSPISSPLQANITTELLLQLSTSELVEHLDEVMTVLASMRPGDETMAMDIVDKLVDAEWPNAAEMVGHRHGFYILRPFFHFALLPNLDVVVSPKQPVGKLLKVVTTLRGSDRPLLTSNWLFTPLHALLDRRKSQIFKQLPPAWDAEDLQLVRATLLFAQLTGGLGRLDNRTLISEAINVYLLDTVDDGRETYRDGQVDAGLRAIAALVLKRREQRSSPLQKAIEDNSIFQRFTQFLALFDEVSFGDHLFGQFVYPFISQRYSKDFRVSLFVEHRTALRLLRHKAEEVPCETGNLSEYFEPAETDVEVLTAFAQSLTQTLSTDASFLRLIALFHVASSLQRSDLPKEAEVRIRNILSSHPGLAELVTDFDCESFRQRASWESVVLKDKVTARSPPGDESPSSSKNASGLEAERPATSNAMKTEVPGVSALEHGHAEGHTEQAATPTETTFSTGFLAPSPLEQSEALEEHDRTVLTPASRADAEVGFWERSKKRAQEDRSSLHYVLRSGVAGGIAGCVAKTAIAPLDRVKILFQTSNADFKKYAGTSSGLFRAIGLIYRTQGPIGLLQGHSATLLRIFPYAGIKFMAYERLESRLMPDKKDRTPGRLFLAGSLSGVTSVFVTYPLELIRVRLAFQTRQDERTNFRQVVRLIYNERLPGHLPVLRSLEPFYRGFTVTLLGMVPYAGTSFLTYGTLKRKLPQYFPQLEESKTVRDLTCGAIAGAVSQTASYPFEVVRRRMQVGGRKALNWSQAVQSIMKDSGPRGFFVGLSIGYIKVVPMTSLSFATWQLMKRVMDI